VLSVQGSLFTVGEVEKVWLVQVWLVGAGWCRAWWQYALLLLEKVSMVAAWSDVVCFSLSRLLARGEAVVRLVPDGGIICRA
jgi:hypothetical protein